MLFILLIIILTYLVLIVSLIIGFDKTPTFSLKIHHKTTNNRKFTIIIPFRNEAENISALAKSLERVNYPINDFEIIFINDGSTDNSVPLITEFIIKNINWKLIDNKRISNSPKKDAITLAINQSKYNWIITTDADCILPENWLVAFNDFIELNKNVKIIAAPVSYKINNSFLHQFQLMDFLSLIGTTIGSFGLNKPFMCNGANLCYSKQAFLSVHGFEGNNTIASGDDVFLLEKIYTKYPKNVRFLKSTNVLVITKPENTFKNLINQRIRWASKTIATKIVFNKITGIIVLLTNLVIFILWFFVWFVNYKAVFLFILLIKFIVDYVLLKKTYQFVHQKMNVFTFLISGFIYPFFVIYIVINTLFIKVNWK